ncbi:MAG TPA: hypothetical protein VLI05_05445 [Candidatus Saccharimonadia bacterium]|nr:hypothetical protein [Candidatus Saccharimonadia bacterium]
MPSSAYPVVVSPNGTVVQSPLLELSQATTPELHRPRFPDATF